MTVVVHPKICLIKIHFPDVASKKIILVELVGFSAIPVSASIIPFFLKSSLIFPDPDNVI